MADFVPKLVPKDKRLDSWKEIADYLGRDKRTVTRWEKERGLPVHRIPGLKRAGVYAWPSEIDSWLDSNAAQEPGVSGSTEVTAAPPPSPAVPAPIPNSRSRKLWVIGAAFSIFLALAAGYLEFRRGPALPRVGKPVQITSDGRDKYIAGLAGTSLFLFSIGGGQRATTRIEQNGNQSPLPFKRDGLSLEDVSSDGSELLVTDLEAKDCHFPLWVVPANGGPSRRLAGLCAANAAWSPDGRKLAYVTGRGLFLANADGTEPRRLATLPFQGDRPRWSPDGRKLRLNLNEQPSFRLWEASVDGSGVRRLLPGWSGDRGQEYDGRWTPDGRFFLFGALHNGTYDLWAIRERAGLFDWRDRGPFRVTTSLNGVGQPILSKDGKKLFTVANTPERGDLMRYDPGSRGFATYPDPAGLSAGHVNFSRDGKHVAYVTHPKMGLWKMNADGTGREMLAEHAALPQWSPDGRRIAYMGINRDSRVPTKIQVISAEGGTPQQPVQSPEWQGVPTWTADGSGLIFGENDQVFPIRASCSIHRFDFKSGKTSDLPGSTGLWSARACPTGRYIAAVTRDDRKLVLYDMRTAAWTELASFADSVIGDNPSWSGDGKFIYIDAPESSDPAIYRISILNKRKERVASLKGIQRIHGDMGAWIGLTPDNRPLILRAVESNEIFAWDWIAP